MEDPDTDDLVKAGKLECSVLQTNKYTFYYSDMIFTQNIKWQEQHFKGWWIYIQKIVHEIFIKHDTKHY